MVVIKFIERTSQEFQVRHHGFNPENPHLFRSIRECTTSSIANHRLGHAERSQNLFFRDLTHLDVSGITRVGRGIYIVNAVFRSDNRSTANPPEISTEPVCQFRLVIFVNVALQDKQASGSPIVEKVVAVVQLGENFDFNRNASGFHWRHRQVRVEGVRSP